MFAYKPDRPKVLLVDDKVRNLVLIKNILTPLNLDFYIAKNGEEAIKRVTQTNFDMVLLDILMPDMDGSQVAENLLLEPTTKNIPIVFLTALAQKKEIESAEGVIGGRTFIAKPVNPQELIARIDMVLGK